MPLQKRSPCLEVEALRFGAVHPFGMKMRDLAPLFGMALVFVAVELLAILLVPSFHEAGLQATEDPTDPANTILYVVLILVFTGGLLVAMRYGFDWVVRVAILGSAAALVYYVLSVFLPFMLAVVFALGIALLLNFYPEWYVIDVAGILMGAGGAAIFGISFGLLPSLLLLVLLAVYDAIAVYRTKHMLTLAEGVMDQSLPVLFVVPKKLSYSFLDADLDTEDREGERDAFFMGLGDAVVPSVLIASSARFVEAPLAGNYAVWGAFVGSLLGFVVLMYLVSKGKPHAGLPLLNGGTILGFFVGLVVLGQPVLETIGL